MFLKSLFRFKFIGIVIEKRGEPSSDLVLFLFFEDDSNTFDFILYILALISSSLVFRLTLMIFSGSHDAKFRFYFIIGSFLGSSSTFLFIYNSFWFIYLGYFEKPCNVWYPLKLSPLFSSFRVLELPLSSIGT